MSTKAMAIRSGSGSARMRTRIAAVFMAMAVLQPLWARAATPPTFEERLEAAFVELRQKNLSTVVGISHRSGPVIVREFGAAAADGVPPATTQVDINSITKTVTGAMMMKLIEQGRVRLDETLADIFPSVPRDKAGITVHQLLTHSAGFDEAVGDDEERLNKRDFLQRAFSSRLIQPPGRKYAYSNVGYSVLAAIIEERSGKSYDDYLQQDVLAGLNLRNTGYMSVYEDRRSLRTASGDSIMTASWGGHEPYWNLIGNGGLISTVEEFIHFRQAFKAGEIVSPELVREAQRKHVPENQKHTSYYGYGLVVQDHPELGCIYWHDGGNDIYSAIWVDLLEHGDIIFTAAVDANEQTATDVLNVLTRHLYGVDIDP